MALRIGLTGGIGSGKSTVAAMLVEQGAALIDADAISRACTAAGGAALPAIAREFGPQLIAADGALDRAAMRELVFRDPGARQRLEAIVHPRVRTAMAAACRAAQGDYAVASIPLLAEGGGRTAYPWLSRVLVVDVPVDVQRARLLRRDGIDDALARAMIDAQASRQQRLAIADDVLVNVGALEALEPQVAALDRLYRSLASGAT